MITTKIAECTDQVYCLKNDIRDHVRKNIENEVDCARTANDY